MQYAVDMLISCFACYVMGYIYSYECIHVMRFSTLYRMFSLVLGHWHDCFSTDEVRIRIWSTGIKPLQPTTSLQWRHNGRDGVSNHQPRVCLLNRLFSRRSKSTSKLRVTCLCAGNSPVSYASYAENVSIWWRYHDNTNRWHICGTYSKDAIFHSWRQLHYEIVLCLWY